MLNLIFLTQLFTPLKVLSTTAFLNGAISNVAKQCKRGMQSTEEAFLLLTHRSRVWFSAIPKTYFNVSEIYRQCWLENVNPTHLVLASGKGHPIYYSGLLSKFRTANSHFSLKGYCRIWTQDHSAMCYTPRPPIKYLRWRQLYLDALLNTFT